MKIVIEVNDEWLKKQVEEQERPLKVIKDDVKNFFTDYAKNPDLLIDRGVFNY